MDKLLFHLIIQTMLLTFLAGVFFFGKLPRRITVHFFLLTLCLIEWLYLDAMVMSEQYIQVVSNIMFLFLAFIPSAAVSLIYRLYYKKNMFFPALIYFPAIIFSLLIIFTKTLIESSIPIGYHVSYIYGPYFWIFKLWLYCGLLLLVALIKVNVDNRLVITKTHSRTLLYSVIALYIFHFSGYILIPILTGSFALQSLTNIVDVLFFLFFYYTLAQKHPLDPIVLLKKISVSFFIYMAVFALISLKWLFESYDHADSVVFFIAAVLIIIGYIPLRKLFVIITDRVFYLKGYDYYGALMLISERIREYNDISELGNYIVVVLRETMKLEKVSLYLYEEERDEYVCSYYTGMKYREFGLVGACEFVNMLKLSSDIIIREECRDSDQTYRKYMDEMKGEVVVPIGKEGELLAYVVLGRKLSGESYTSEDESILGTISNQLFTAIENTNLFSEIKGKAEKLSKLNELQKQILYGQGKHGIYLAVIQDVTESMEAVRGYLLSWNEITQELVCEVAVGARESIGSLSCGLTPALLARLRDGQDVDDAGFDFAGAEKEELDPYIMMPLMDHKEFMGVLVLENKERRGYVKSLDKSMLRIYANYIGNLIKNFSLYNSAVEASNYTECILKAISNIVVTIDVDGKIVSSNEAGKLELGLHIGIDILAYVGNEELGMLVRRTLDTREEIVNRELKRMGLLEEKEYTLSMKFISGEHAGKQNLLIVMTDVTEIKSLKNELLQKERLVTIANMAAVIVHEIRNPLTAVGTLTKLMPKMHNDAEYLELFNSIVPKELERVNALMEDLLELSRTKKLEKTKIMLYELLNDRRKVMEEVASELSVGIELSGADIEIMGDERKLTQVFQNIMQNGIQAMDQTGGILKVSILDELIEKDGAEVDMCIICIADTGKGMNGETIENIFKPFYTTKENGTGLGLAITQKIIEDHCGMIKVKSEPGCGTQFSIFLPKK